MAERLGLGIIPGAGWRAAETRAVTIEAEEAGFDAVFTAEVNSDALATAQLMAEATRRVKVGTWIANIHMRHSYAYAKSGRADRRCHWREDDSRPRGQPSARQRSPRR
jgi:alkanesulfonate monooxygenase SsuD/methylene tetrahydromethanopterin reductase-like flavin-dependent oxidoreductase (luciferase family)